MNEHVQQQSQHRTQQSYPSPGGMAPSDTPGRPVLQRAGYYPGYPSSPSPNITMGSPLRNLPEGKEIHIVFYQINGDGIDIFNFMVRKYFKHAMH